jgi:hypothetical protein
MLDGSIAFSWVHVGESLPSVTPLIAKAQASLLSKAGVVFSSKQNRYSFFFTQWFSVLHMR